MCVTIIHSRTAGTMRTIGRACVFDGAVLFNTTFTRHTGSGVRPPQYETQYLCIYGHTLEHCTHQLGRPSSDSVGSIWILPACLRMEYGTHNTHTRTHTHTIHNKTRVSAFARFFTIRCSSGHSSHGHRHRHPNNSATHLNGAAVLFLLAAACRVARRRAFAIMLMCKELLKNA